MKPICFYLAADADLTLILVSGDNALTALAYQTLFKVIMDVTIENTRGAAGDNYVQQEALTLDQGLLVCS